MWRKLELEDSVKDEEGKSFSGRAQKSANKAIMVIKIRWYTLICDSPLP